MFVSRTLIEIRRSRICGARMRPGASNFLEPRFRPRGSYSLSAFEGAAARPIARPFSRRVQRTDHLTPPPKEKASHLMPPHHRPRRARAQLACSVLLALTDM